MKTLKRLRELWLSFAAGQSMVPFGDNGAAIRRLSQQIAARRAAEPN
jgi:hypothetical protein